MRSAPRSGVVNSVTAEQIAKSPDGDAAQAVQRVSGVTVQDGKYVFVRGLGERYTTSSLNGARMPSPEPEKRVVPLDMFPAGLLQTITTSKTFTPDLQGDFSGALVDIRTREFPAQPHGSAAARQRIRVRRDGIAAARGHARWAARRSAKVEPSARPAVARAQRRQLPGRQPESGRHEPARRVVPQRVDAEVGDGRADCSTARRRSAATIRCCSAIVSGYLVSGTMLVRHGRQGRPDPRARRSRHDEGRDDRDRSLHGQTASQSVLWGGLANLSTMLGEGRASRSTALYNRSADNDARVEIGEFTADAHPGDRSRACSTRERGVYSGQLAGEHQLGSAQRIEWSATASGVRRYEPDRTAFVQVHRAGYARAGPRCCAGCNGGSGGAVRTFSDLNENSHEYAREVPARLRPRGLADDAQGRRAVSRHDPRCAEPLVFLQRERHDATPARAAARRRSSTAGSRSQLERLHLRSAVAGRLVRRDTIALTAGFAMAEVPFGVALRVVGGARYESDHLDVTPCRRSARRSSTKKLWNDLLPSLALNIKLTETQQLRLSGVAHAGAPRVSRAVADHQPRRHRRRERAAATRTCRARTSRNADMRWEMYPERRRGR